MKRKLLFIGLVPMFLLAVISFSYVHAQETPTTTTETDSEANREQRIEERKDRLKTRLDSNQFKRLTLRCGGAQGKLNSLIVRFENSDKPYRVKYDNYVQRLEKLQTRLKENDVDTAKLDEQITELKQKVQALKTAVDAFVVDVNDAKTMDCKADPVGFKAALEDAKVSAVALKAARQDLEAYARETIKPTIQELKTTVKNNKKSEQ
jgi:hypothetical protein